MREQERSCTDSRSSGAVLSLSHTPSDPVPSHRPVLDAVAAHDPDAAERAMRALVDRSMQDLTNAR